MKEQYLDGMDLERERGITIKLNAVQLEYVDKDDEEYTFHLIDTPGHVDFTYEVSRSLAACEGAILVVDAAQGIEAQTLANVYLALDNDLEIIPAINKIDLPNADTDRVTQELVDVIGIDPKDVILASAKDNIGIDEILDQIVNRIPPPGGNAEGPLKGLIFDSLYDSYRGVVAYICVKDGSVKVGDTIQMMANGVEYEVNELGVSTPSPMNKDELIVEDVGYLTAAIKDVSDARVGDTITLADNPAEVALPGYRRLNPMVYCGLYPVDSDNYNDLREALERLELNDAALQYEPETSQALGFGFRSGFLGLLHMEIIQERIEREFNIDLITTAPSVIYEVKQTDGKILEIDNPSFMPDPQVIEEIREPFVKAMVMVPNDYVGTVMELCQKKEGNLVIINILIIIVLIFIYKFPFLELFLVFFFNLNYK